MQKQKEDEIYEKQRENEVKSREQGKQKEKDDTTHKTTEEEADSQTFDGRAQKFPRFFSRGNRQLPNRINPTV